MKYFFRRAAVLLLMWTAGMSVGVAATLTVIAEGLRDSHGQVGVAVFASDSGFPQDDSKAIRRLFVPLQHQTDSATAVITDLPVGTYALAIFHDSDNSGKLETNFFGIPRKGYGFSNNVNPSMRSARFNEAAFTLPPAGTSVRIKLVYR